MEIIENLFLMAEVERRIDKGGSTILFHEVLGHSQIILELY